MWVVANSCVHESRIRVNVMSFDLILQVKRNTYRMAVQVSLIGSALYIYWHVMPSDRVLGSSMTCRVRSLAWANSTKGQRRHVLIYQTHTLTSVSEMPEVPRACSCQVVTACSA